MKNSNPIAVIIVFLASNLFFNASRASAAFVTWTLENVNFNDAGTLEGSFSYDVFLNQYKNINILASGGDSRFQPVTYTDINLITGFGSPSAGKLELLNFDRDLTLLFDPPFNALNDLGTVSEVDATETCIITCNFPFSLSRTGRGEVTSEENPNEPVVKSLDVNIFGITYQVNFTVDSFLNLYGNPSSPNFNPPPFWENSSESVTAIFAIKNELNALNPTPKAVVADGVTYGEFFFPWTAISPFDVDTFSSYYLPDFNSWEIGSRIFSLEGQTTYAILTPKTPHSVPEPSSTLSLLALGTLGAASTLKRKLKPSKPTTKELEKVG